MADLAREEADRFFSTKNRLTSHPEDLAHDEEDSDIDSNTHVDDKYSNNNDDDDDGHYSHSDPGTDDDDIDTTAKMVATSQARSRFHLPATASHANTGPKGVIADAQSFQRAKQQQQRVTLRSKLTRRMSLSSRTGGTTAVADASSALAEKKYRKAIRGGNGGSSSEDDNNFSDGDEDESDSAFMKSWRQKRFQELSTMTSQQQQQQQRQQHQQRNSTWAATVQDVDASGYLDAIEKAGRNEIVVVLIYEVGSSWSRRMEVEMGMLAYKYSSSSSSAAAFRSRAGGVSSSAPKVRFVKLDQEIAEMESVEVPAVLAYRDGDVFATISAAQPDDLEDDLKNHGVLPLL